MEGAIDMELLKLKAFSLTLEDKAKIWLSSLRPRTIRNWTKMQAEFMKKFFSTHKTNTLKRQIPLQPMTIRSFTSAGRDIWKPSTTVLTMVLILGCWSTIYMMGCPSL